MLLWIVVFRDQQCGFEYTCLYRLYFDLGRKARIEAHVHGRESALQFAPYRHPFCSFEIAVLEEKHERRGSEQRGVLPVKLRFAVLRRLVRGWLRR